MDRPTSSAVQIQGTAELIEDMRAVGGPDFVDWASLYSQLAALPAGDLDRIIEPWNSTRDGLKRIMLYHCFFGGGPQEALRSFDPQDYDDSSS